MKIERIVFVRSVQMASGKWLTSVAAVEHRLEVDSARRFVTVDGCEVPWPHVLRVDYEQDAAESASEDYSVKGVANPVQCPECGQLLADARALGAHRRHKHGVVGGRAA